MATGGGSRERTGAAFWRDELSQSVSQSVSPGQIDMSGKRICMARVLSRRVYIIRTEKSNAKTKS